MKHKNSFNLLIIFCFIIFFTGCAIVRPTVQLPSRTINYPNIGDISSANVGDTITKKANIYEIEGIKLLDEARFANLVFYPGFKPIYGTCSTGTLYSKGSMDLQNKDPIMNYFLVINNKTGNLEWTANGGLVGPGAVSGSSKFKNNPRYENTTEIAQGSASFTQELIYNGKTGNTIKFLYRELKGGYMRDAFSQDLQYDLADGNVIGFKEVRVEVIQATNTNIKYKLINGFK